MTSTLEKASDMINKVNDRIQEFDTKQSKIKDYKGMIVKFQPAYNKDWLGMNHFDKTGFAIIQ